MKNTNKIHAVVEEAVKILNDYPGLKYYQAIIKAKEVLKDENNIRECSGGDYIRRSNKVL